MKARRLHGLSLGLAIVLVNILLVGVLVVATSSRSLSDLWASGEPTPTSTPTMSPTAEPPTATPTVDVDPSARLRERFADGEPLSIVVLGDQTGTHENDWVQAWARDLAQARPVELLAPSGVDPTRYAEPIAVDSQPETSEAGLITLRNASLVGATPQYMTPRLALFVPADADVVILNFGRSNTPADIASELDELVSALEAAVPQAHVTVIVQPPRPDGEQALDDTVREWAERADVRSLDVATAFEDDGLVESTISTRDPLSVNILGGRAWARIVQDDLFGPLELASSDEPLSAPEPTSVIPQQPIPTAPAAAPRARSAPQPPASTATTQPSASPAPPEPTAASSTAPTSPSPATTPPAPEPPAPDPGSDPAAPEPPGEGSQE